MNTEVTAGERALMALKLQGDIRELIRKEMHDALSDATFLNNLSNGALRYYTTRVLKYDGIFRDAVVEVVKTLIARAT